MNSIERGRVRKITVIGAGQGEADGARGLRRGREANESEAAGHLGVAGLGNRGLFIFPMAL